MKTEIKINNTSYQAIKNNDTGYFEIDIVAPQAGGIYAANIKTTSVFGITEETVKNVQVLTIIKEKELNKRAIAYFLDRFTFDIKDVVDLQDFEINVDEETNSNSYLTIVKKINAGDKDFVVINEDDKISYIGIINSPVNENGEQKYSITSKYITNLFDRDIILKNESLISSTGVEDFIKYTIENEFTKSTDTLLNIKYLDVEVLSHTKIQKSVDNVENGIYNFHTYITNCTQNYNISYSFKIENGRLKMSIKKINTETILIDTNISDIANYSEVFETNVVSKVTVKTANNVFNYFLLADRTTSTDINNKNRAVGLVKTVYTEKDEDAKQTAMNEFKGNSYEHLVQFDINKKSKLFDLENLEIGTPVKLRTKSNIVVNTYISAITRKKSSEFYSIKTGNIRINFIEKLLKKERK